jgi:hypothetical protein
MGRLKCFDDRLRSSHFWPEGVLQGLQSFFLQINIAEIVIHKTDQPDAVVNFFDSDRLAARDTLRLIFLLYRQRRRQLVTTTVRSWNG